MKRIFNFFKKNPIIGISVTAFIITLIYKFRNGINQTIESTTGMDIKRITKSTPRGVRNNNPLNIRIGGSLTNPWKGQILEGRKDSAFVEFDTMLMGARAGIKLLMSYPKKGFDTLDKIITRWAPASDGNNPYSYVSLVIKDCAKNGLVIDKNFKPSTAYHFAQIAHSMSAVELGKSYQPDISVFSKATAIL